MTGGAELPLVHQVVRQLVVPVEGDLPGLGDLARDADVEIMRAFDLGRSPARKFSGALVVLANFSSEAMPRVLNGRRHEIAGIAGVAAVVLSSIFQTRLARGLSLAFIVEVGVEAVVAQAVVEREIAP